MIATSQFKIVLTAEMEADESTPYFLKPDRNYFYDDETQLTVNTKGLLSTANATAEDRTADIINDLVQTIATAEGLRIGTNIPERLHPFYYSFHPSNLNEVNWVKRRLQEMNINFNVIASEAGQAMDPGKSAIQSAAANQKGIIFRPGKSYTIALSSAQLHLNTSKQFIMPDTNVALVLDYSRMPFVKKITNVGFTDGMLTDFHQTLPSPILGFVGIPKSIIQALIPIPFGSPAGSGTNAGTSSTAKSAANTSTATKAKP